MNDDYANDLKEYRPEGGWVAMLIVGLAVAIGSGTLLWLAFA